MGSRIWVVVQDDGLGTPLAGFLSQAEADAYAKHQQSDWYSHSVREVPLMRFVPAVIEPTELPTTPPTGESHG
ncbi:hypothetical protein [Enterovirga rhinocerotis]|uniref:Uncharacterized protein n=1 Tax=Enterovirga rhinocerotis TaxID=1339210 RepID=A0A4R7BXM8_9HYPH|nr:hypothetical protein [Enterovirga rhinocerotis]TDR90263.1 hypothetical protein EV668_3109 [Enterovirga rhinocerotis]